MPDPLYEHPAGGWLAAAGAGGEHISDRAWLAKQLEDSGVERAVLCTRQAMMAGSVPSASYGEDLARAINDWTIEHWLSTPGPFYGLITIATQVPESAVAEIRRAGRHPRMVGVLLAGNGLSRPFGSPSYHAVYDAAADLGLPIVLYPGTENPPSTSSHPIAGGYPSSYGEYHALRAQSVISHLVSLIVQGVLERHRSLRVFVIGVGLSWLPPLAWRLDNDFRALAFHETPWLKRYPSQQIAEQVRVGTSSLLGTPATERMVQFLERLTWLQDVVCFASGFPRWDADTLSEAEIRLPRSWRSRLRRENALASLRWADRPAEVA
jgi:predicted TIM-barrel fold metal-dependent hydrolase